MVFVKIKKGCDRVINNNSSCCVNALNNCKSKDSNNIWIQIRFAFIQRIYQAMTVVGVTVAHDSFKRVRLNSHFPFFYMHNDHFLSNELPEPLRC